MKEVEAKQQSQQLSEKENTPPEQEICAEVLVEKYAKGGESTVEDVRRRVARALAAVEPDDKRAYW